MKKLLKRAAGLVLALCLLTAVFAGAALADDYVQTSGKVNVRTGPGLNYDSLGTVADGSRLTYRGETATDSRGVAWYKVAYNSYSDGWISSKYASLNSYSQVVTATGGQTYIRDAANLNGNDLGVLRKGERATYLNQSSTDSRGVVWYRVNYNGTVGWVSSRYTTLGSGSSSSGGSSSGGSTSTTRKVTAVSGQTNIRTAGNLEAQSLGVLPEGKSATYLNETTTDYRGVRWYRVSYNGTTGWVSSRYTKLDGDSSTSVVTRKVVATGGQTNIRTSGNLDAKSIGVLPKGYAATYLDQSSTDERGVVWYRVDYSGTKGWVSSRYTTLK